MQRWVLERGLTDHSKSVLTISVIGWGFSILSAVMFCGFAMIYFIMQQQSSSLDRIEARIESIPQRISEEFRAMRAEMAAQTSAIANGSDLGE